MAYPINPDRNEPWNKLPELPIEESLFKTIDVYEQLGNAKSALARLQGRSIAIPNQGLLINSISLQEAKASSAIENIFTTDDELYKAFSEHTPDQLRGASQEVLQYREALWLGFQHLKHKEGFDQKYLELIYRQVKTATDGIRSPLVQTVIRHGGTGPNAGRVVYSPPRGKGIIEQKINNLLLFMNNDEIYKLDHLLKMVIGHFQFEAIHPFRNGNGRTGRIFNIHYLCQKGLLDYPILFLSKYILDNKDDYYRALTRVSQFGDWQTWLIYMLKAVEQTSNLTYIKINDIIAAKDAILREIVSLKEISRPESLVNHIFTQPFTRVKHLTEQGIYAENTARNYLNRLCEMQILERRTIKGSHYYLNTELYRILGA
ncbi:MAG: Fic family protein [Bacteroidota bacterium]